MNKKEDYCKILRKLTFCPSNFFFPFLWTTNNSIIKMCSMQRDHHKLHLPKLQKKILYDVLEYKKRRVFFTCYHSLHAIHHAQILNVCPTSYLSILPHAHYSYTPVCECATIFFFKNTILRVLHAMELMKKEKKCLGKRDCKMK